VFIEIAKKMNRLRKSLYFLNKSLFHKKNIINFSQLNNYAKQKPNLFLTRVIRFDPVHRFE
jgi:hypothetical protein